LWILVCALEEHEAKGHPVGLALFKKGIQELGPAWLNHSTQTKLSDIASVPGQGVAGRIGIDIGQGSPSWHRVCIGGQAFLEKDGVALGFGLKGPSSGEGRSGIAVQIGVDGICAATLRLQVCPLRNFPCPPNPPTELLYRIKSGLERERLYRL
jgi:cation transport ATPase